jgi:hypothetical protein
MRIIYQLRHIFEIDVFDFYIDCLFNLYLKVSFDI